MLQHVERQGTGADGWWGCDRRVGDPSKEMSEEFVITLKTSLAPGNKYTYPLVYAPVIAAPYEQACCRCI